MNVWMVRYEFAPATIAIMANSMTCGRRYSLPSARRGSSISASKVRNGVNGSMAISSPWNSGCPEQSQRLRSVETPYRARPHRIAAICGIFDSLRLSRRERRTAVGKGEPKRVTEPAAQPKPADEEAFNPRILLPDGVHYLKR